MILLVNLGSILRVSQVPSCLFACLYLLFNVKKTF